MNYLQLTTVTAGFDLAWPAKVSLLLDTQSHIGNASEQVFNLECFRREEESQQYSVFLKLLMATCAPLIILLMAACFWTLIALCYSRWACLKYELVNSLSVTLFLVHPSLFKVAADCLNCMQIESGEFWMNSDLNIRCWDSHHSRFALGVALPSLILWGILLPMGVLLVLIRLRNDVTELNVRIRFGFLYSGYQWRKFYWEFAILYRKALLILIEVFLSTVSVPTQGLLAALVLLVAFILQMKRKPFTNPVFNRLEQRSILVSIITIYCGLIFLTSEVGDSLHIFLFTLLLLANAYFTLYWLFQAGRELLGKLLIRSHVYRTDVVAPENTNQSRLNLRGLEEREASAGADIVPQNSLVRSEEKEA